MTRGKNFETWLAVAKVIQQQKGLLYSPTLYACSVKKLSNYHAKTLFETIPGCLQLLEILEIWNLIGTPGNFCVRCRRSTALVSSHKTGY